MKTTPEGVRLETLDSLRFIAALWVAVSHGAIPVRDVTNVLAPRMFMASFNGVAAVVVFFIISGFCIHLPYAAGKPLIARTFLVRRLLRVGLPLLCVQGITEVVGGTAATLSRAVLWTIYCELTYYCIYPLIEKSLSRTRIVSTLAACSLVASVMTLLHPEYLRPWQFGALTWLWGLPIWLSGCYLAVRFVGNTPPVVDVNIHLLRMSIWGLGAVGTFLASNASVRIGYPVSMLIFAIPAFVWVARELDENRLNGPVLPLLGRAGYSLYLIHPVAIGLTVDMLQASGTLLRLAAPGTAIVILTFLFYRLVEAPAHDLARRAAGA